MNFKVEFSEDKKEAKADFGEVIKGDKGDKGDPGERGERGPQGERGERGEQGEPGSIEVIEGGSKAFRIFAVDGNNITLDSTEGLELGHHCSADCGNNYNGFGYITAINGNTITVDTALTNYTIEEDSVLWIPEHPELGTTKIGEGAYNLGVNCKANQKGAFASGMDNISDGKYSTVGGRGNYAGYNATVFGRDNFGKGFNSLTTGKGNKNWNQNTILFGLGNHTLTDNTLIGGLYALNSVDLLFALGNGTAENPSNAIDVTFDGKMRLAKSLTVGGNNTNSGSYSAVIGYGNKLSGYQCFIQGESNETVNPHTWASAIFGYNNKTHDANCAFVAGDSNDAYTGASAVFGRGNKSYREGALIGGRYSKNSWNHNYLFAIGNGTKDAPSNAIAVTETGDMELGGKAIILNSSTSGSTKRFKITVDDSGKITATEI